MAYSQKKATQKRKKQSATKGEVAQSGREDSEQRKGDVFNFGEVSAFSHDDQADGVKNS